jgi:hypothetical protein
MHTGELEVKEKNSRHRGKIKAESPPFRTLGVEPRSPTEAPYFKANASGRAPHTTSEVPLRIAYLANWCTLRPKLCEATKTIDQPLHPREPSCEFDEYHPILTKCLIPTSVVNSQHAPYLQASPHLHARHRAACPRAQRTRCRLYSTNARNSSGNALTRWKSMSETQWIQTQTTREWMVGKGV